MAVAIADNDAQPSARDLVEGIAVDHPLEVCYLHAPQANISIARNALLDPPAPQARGYWSIWTMTRRSNRLANASCAAWRDADAGAVLGRCAPLPSRRAGLDGPRAGA